MVLAGCLSDCIIHRTLTWTMGSLTCAETLMHVNCTQECTDTIRQSALKADSGKKIPCCTREPNLHQQHAGTMLYQLSYIIIIIIINPLTARVVGAPQMTLQPFFSIFPCSTLPSGTWWTPGLSIPWCCLPTPSSVCVAFFPLSLCLARWFWPDLSYIPTFNNGQMFDWGLLMEEREKDHVFVIKCLLHNETNNN